MTHRAQAMTWRELADQARSAGRISEVEVEWLVDVAESELHGHVAQRCVTISVFVAVEGPGLTDYSFQEEMPASEYGAIIEDARAGLLPGTAVAAMM